ncbi:TrlF family AAA-like ATPase [Candidatus Poriferisodalis sp.]|uniref:TrlF family AAA-like ATPase n=1 Tax=Candidatus Poriferisodalis sp. TaxID=3101277 RepID=UPI003B58DD88
MDSVNSQNQGSLWRRWDPHVHLPGTLANDQFGTMSIEEALGQLSRAQPQIEAIGVTDYFTSASYRAAADALSKGVAPSIRFAFPNVELRLDNATSSNHGVNIHLLCPPEAVDQLDQFIGGLEFSWSEKTFRADRSGLIQLGREFSGDPNLAEFAALQTGAAQFKVNFEQLRRHMRADQWAAENVLVAVAGGGRDGTSGLRDQTGSFAARRQAIERFAHIVFSGSPQQAKFWAGEGNLSEAQLEQTYGGVKLCLHGSDAHDPSRLGRPDNDRYCWLNGDPIFDTLRLACLSPSTRSFIGQESPAVSSTYGRVIKIAVPDENWFTNGDIAINPGLVAIIGPRGSGKTALADLIAAGAGSREPFDNDSSFIRRAGRLLTNASVRAEWSHDETMEHRLSGTDIDEGYLRPVRYLSQQFVERLCASDGVSDQLLKEIERVIFEAWPGEERQGATNFRQLLEIQLTSARARQSAKLQELLECNDRISELRLAQRQVESKRSERAQHEKQLERLEGQMTSLTANADQESANRLAVVSEVFVQRQGIAQALDRRRTALNGLLSAVSTARSTTFPQYHRRLRSEYSESGLTNEQWDYFTVDFEGHIDGLIEGVLREVDQQLHNLKGAPVDDQTQTILDELTHDELSSLPLSQLSSDIGRLQELVGLDAARRKRLTKLNESTAAARTHISRLSDEIERVQSVDVDELVSNRRGHYESYFQALIEEEEALRTLYEPLSAVLQDIGSSVSKLRFSVRRVVDIGAWTRKGEELLDLRKEGRFRGEGALQDIAQTELVEAWENGNAKEAADAISNFVQEYSRDIRSQQPTRATDTSSIADWERSVSRWLFRTDHIRLQYSLDYDGLNIERLSPGTRGIVLLLLYLAVDQQESDPLIIDQPEENLDPESIHSELVRLFRLASQRRQIIMVTHNANLVVNTDVDQVIVARCGPLAEGRLPEIEYRCGGLENSEIRRLVCEILEGGEEAFRQRARRLGLERSVGTSVLVPQ